MPEYSTPTLTPAGTSKLTGMNGSSAGNFLVSDILDIIRNTFGQANGVATLDGSGKLPTAQLPDIADDVLVYASKALLPAQGVEAKIYITTDDNVLYRWDATLGDYVQLSVDLSDYATLDDLAAEESARETSDANLNNAITAIDHRLDNLEQPKGGYVVSTYKDGSITPSGKGNWAVVEGLRGVSRCENSLITEATKTGSAEGLSYSRVNNHVTVTGTYQSGGDANAYIFSNDVMPETNGHNYLVFVANPKFSLYIFGATTVGVQNAIVFPATASGQMQLTARATGFSNGVSVNESFDVIVCDLSVYFGTTDLSFLGATNAEKLATIQTNYPHLLLPSDYGTRIVDSSYSGVRAWAKNLVDIPTTTWASDGSKTFSIDIPIGTYTLSMTSSQARAWIAYLRDSDGEITQASSASSASGRQSVTFTLTRKATTLVVYVNGATVMSDVQIEEGSTATAYTPYHAPSTLTLTFTGKSAGSVYDSCEPNVEVDGVAKKRETSRIETVDLGDKTWQYSSNYGFFYYFDTSVKVSAELICSGYVFVGAKTDTEMQNADNMTIASGPSTGLVKLKNTSKTASDLVNGHASWLEGVKLNYEKSDPTVTLSDPLIDNTLLTESGGRMATVQTGTVVDGSFDMGFINL